MPDVFGLNKRTVEALAAQEQASRYQMIAIDITLSANVAEAAITEASLEDQIATTNELIGTTGRSSACCSTKSRRAISAAQTSLPSRPSWHRSRRPCRR